MIIYFKRGYSDINKFNDKSLEISDMSDISLYAISVDEDGIFIDFEEQKIKVKVGDVIFIKDKQMCTSKKLDRLVEKIFNTKLSAKLDKLDKEAECICEQENCK